MIVRQRKSRQIVWFTKRDVMLVFGVLRDPVSGYVSTLQAIPRQENSTKKLNLTRFLFG